MTFLIKLNLEAYFFEKKGPWLILGASGLLPVWRRHAPGRLGAPFWEAFSIKNRSKIDVNFDVIFDMIFDRFLIDFWRLFGSNIDHCLITFPKQ